MRRTSFSVLIILLVLALGGCGEERKDQPIGPVGGDDTASSEPSPDPSSSPSAQTTPFDDKGNDAIRGIVEADTPEEQAVADAWFAYWDARVASFFKAKVDPRMGSVAAGEAVADVVRHVTHLRSNKHHTVGDTKFSATDIEVKGSTATLKSCGVNKSTDRRADGRPAEQLVPFYNLFGALTKVAGTWRVIEAEARGTNPCRA